MEALLRKIGASKRCDGSDYLSSAELDWDSAGLSLGWLMGIIEICHLCHISKTGLYLDS